MFMSASSPQSGTRTLYLAFYADSLVLPAGLTYVDDLMTANGGWES